MTGLCNGVFVFKIEHKFTSNKARKAGLVTVTNFDPKGTISEVRVHAGTLFGHTGCWSIAKCSQFSCRNYTGGFRSWPPATCRRSFDHHGKGNSQANPHVHQQHNCFTNSIFVQKRSFEKWKKVVSLIDLKKMKTPNDCEIACDCVKRANVVLHVGLCKEIFARKHTATHKPTSAQPLTVTSVTSNNRLWSP